MSAATPPKPQLTQLNHQIDQAEAEVERLQQERKAVARDAARARQQWRYLGFVRWFRKQAAVLPTGPTAAMVIGPTIVGVLLLLLTELIFGAFPLALIGFIFGILLGTGIFAALLYLPRDAQLGAAIDEAEAKRKLQHARLAEKTARLTDMNQRLDRLLAERRDQVATGKLQRAALLQRNWKDMRGAEWEDFVVEVCRTLGAEVDRGGRVHDDGANFIAQLDNRRVAIFTEGEGHNVASATIQKAIAARASLRCDSCAVIINRRFTGAAQDFARRNGCTPIGAGEFPDFVLGKIEL